ncbi:hypothetical protein H0A65_03010 [Alcaligenaceae bacterium]|nr:hypothetical protein [Alcaligenaceae bacterium]
MKQTHQKNLRVQRTSSLSAVRVDQARFHETSSVFGVGSNLHALGQHLQEVWDRGSSEEFGALYAVLNRSAGQGSESYAHALKDLSPGVLAAPAALKQADGVVLELTHELPWLFWRRHPNGRE